MYPSMDPFRHAREGVVIVRADRVRSALANLRETGVQELLGLAPGVGGMEQNHAQPGPAAPRGGDQARARGIGESGLDAVGARIAENQQLVVVVEVELSA